MKILLLLILVLSSMHAEARSSTERKAFTRYHPCPATGKLTGKCHGWVVDHIIPLCAGGADKPSNMQWQQLAASKRKDVLERQQCKKLKRN